MSPLEPREAGDVVTPTSISNSNDVGSGWTFQAWAIAIPLGIILMCFLGFVVYYWCHRKEIAQRRAGSGEDWSDWLLCGGEAT